MIEPTPFGRYVAALKRCGELRLAVRSGAATERELLDAEKEGVEALKAYTAAARDEGERLCRKTWEG